jgi:hypothetical protein
MNVLLSFEVNEKQQEVIKELTSLGYMQSWRVTRGRDVLTYFLPSNMLWKKGDTMSPTKAKEDLRKVTSGLNVKLIRAVAVTFGKFDAITGEPL